MNSFLTCLPQRLLLLCAGVVLAACAPEQSAPSADPGDVADKIYTGGTVITVDDTNPSAEAIAVKHGKIIAVGTTAALMALRGEQTDVVDVDGRTIVPGFIDGHLHLGGLGAQAIGANLLAPPDGHVETIDDLVDVMREFAAGPDVDRTGWVFGLGYDDAVLKEGRHPTAADLDRVSTELPVIAIHISGHFAAINSVGLEKVGYSAATEDPEGGVIRRKPGSREPNGVLEELAAIPIMFGVIAPQNKADQDYFTERGQELAMSFGYTTVQEGRAMTSQHEGMAAFASEGRFKIDVVTYMDYLSRSSIETEWHSRDYQHRYRIGGLKITLDGSPQGRTAWRTLPYVLPPDGQEEGYLGYPAIPNDADVAALYEEAFEKGWQVLTHANGDAAIDQLIRTMRPSHEKHGPGDRRHVLIHGQLIREDQLDDLKELEVMPSLFPMHTFYWGDWYKEIIGEDMAHKISPTRSALDRGMRITSHTDAPVALPNLMQIMSATVNRTSRSGDVIGPDQRLTPMEALKTITIWGAYQHFEEDRKGSIEVGKLADLVVLSDNPLTIEPMELGTITVIETIKEGETVYRAK